MQHPTLPPAASHSSHIEVEANPADGPGDPESSDPSDPDDSDTPEVQADDQEAQDDNEGDAGNYVIEVGHVVANVLYSNQQNSSLGN